MLTLCYIFNKIPLNPPSQSVTAGSSGIMSLMSTYHPICQWGRAAGKLGQNCWAGTAWQGTSVTRGGDAKQGLAVLSSLPAQLCLLASGFQAPTVTSSVSPGSGCLEVSLVLGAEPGVAECTEGGPKHSTEQPGWARKARKSVHRARQWPNHVLEQKVST